MWLVEERCEDAFRAYLRVTVPGDMRVYVGFTDDELQFPCVVCHAASSDNENDEALFNGHRRVAVEIAVMTEATPELDSSGVMIRSSRDRNAMARGNVMAALAKEALHEDLNDMNVPGIKFSMAHTTEVTRSVEGMNFVSMINVDVIANPVVI